MNVCFFTIIGLLFGTLGTVIGGILGILVRNVSNKSLCFILAVASGLMLSIISFELLPEAMKKTSIYCIIFGIFIGIVTMMICDVIVSKKISFKKNNVNSILKTGIVISIGLAIHNIPEGLAIGAGLDNSIKLGYALAIAIAIHDIPEGISMAVPMKKGGIKISKILFFVFLSGVTTGIGAFVGAIIGNISDSTISVCLAFAAGAMLYIVSGELTPEYSKIYGGKIGALGNILGFLLGIIASSV